MNAARSIRSARRQAGLSQTALAQRAGTSQATLSAYETGRKQPSLATLDRVLAAAGARLAVETAPTAVVQPSEADLARTARRLADVLALAEAMPVRHSAALAYPRLA